MRDIREILTIKKPTPRKNRNKKLKIRNRCLKFINNEINLKTSFKNNIQKIIID